MIKGLDVHLERPEGRTALAHTRSKVEARAIEADPEPITDILCSRDRCGQSHDSGGLLALLLELGLHIAHSADQGLVLGSLVGFGTRGLLGLGVVNQMEMVEEIEGHLLEGASCTPFAGECFPFRGSGDDQVGSLDLLEVLLERSRYVLGEQLDAEAEPFLIGS